MTTSVLPRGGLQKDMAYEKARFSAEQDPFTFLADRYRKKAIFDFAAKHGKYDERRHKKKIDKAVEDYIQSLRGDGLAKVRDEVAKELESTKRRLALMWETEDKKRFYHQPEADADFAYWARQPYWYEEEITALLLGKDPKVVNWEKVSFYKNVSDFVRDYEKILELVRRQFRNLAPSQEVIAWAEKLKLPVPFELAEQVKALHNVIDWEARYREDIKPLEAKLESLESENAHLKAEGTLHPKARTTYLKMLYAMAVKHYKYPDSGATAKLMRLLDESRLSLTDKPIRDALEAANEVAKRELEK